MIRVTRDGGMVIASDANRNAFNALFYTDGLNMQELAPISLGQRRNRDIREKTGIDYNIGMKTPVLTEKAGLKNIGCRLSDRVTFLTPSMEEGEKKRIHKALCDEGLALPENFGKIRQERVDRLLSYGISREVIDLQLDLETELDFRHKGDTYHTVVAGLKTWSYGTVDKSQAISR